MAKRSSTSVRHFAAQVLADRLGPVCELIAQVRCADDPQAVHQMRVASRRLRAALAVFSDALPGKKVKKWRKPMRGLTEALGEARDADVQIAFVEDRLSELDDATRPFAPGIQRLHLRLTQRRQAMQGRVVKAMDQAEASPLLTDMPDDLRRIIVDTRPADPSHDAAPLEPAADPNLRNHARQAIGERLDELLGYEPYVEQPGMTEQLHEMRIAAKRLRYTMEVLQPVFGPRMDTPIKRVRRLQNDLGELHDADVWLDMLPVFIEDERRRTAEYFGHLRSFRRLEVGLEYLLERVQDDRRGAYAAVVERWRKLVDKDAWPKLRRLLRDPIITPAAPPAASPLDAASPTPTTPNDEPAPPPRQIFTQN